MQQRAAGTSFLEIAKAKGITEAQVIAEVTKIETAELDAAVKAGQITEAQRTQYLAALPASIKAGADQHPGHAGSRPGRRREERQRHEREPFDERYDDVPDVLRR